MPTNVNTNKNTITVNVNTTSVAQKKPKKKRSPPKDVPIEPQPEVIRPTVQQPLNPRRPSPYLPNMVQVHNNHISPPPPYFSVPQTNRVITITNMRDRFQVELRDLYHTLTQNATTQTELDHARAVVDQASQAFEDQINNEQMPPQQSPEVHMDEGDLNNQVMPPRQHNEMVLHNNPVFEEAEPEVRMHIPDDVMQQMRNHAINAYNIPVNQQPPIVEEPPSPLVVRNRRQISRGMPYQIPRRVAAPNQVQLPPPEQVNNMLALPAPVGNQLQLPPPEQGNDMLALPAPEGNQPQIHIQYSREAYRDAHARALDALRRLRALGTEARHASARSRIRRDLNAIGASVGVHRDLRARMETLIDRLEELASQ